MSETNHTPKQEGEELGVPTVEVPASALAAALEESGASKSEILNPHGKEHEDLRKVRDRLAEQSGVVLRLGRLLLQAGASAYMVKISMARLAKSVGLEELHAQVSFGEITISSYGHGTFRTEVAEQRTFGTNATLLDNMRSYVRSLKPDMLVEQVHRDLDRITSAPAAYPALINWLASGVACGCFCFLNKGGLVECLTVTVAAFFGQMLRRSMFHRKMNHFGIWMMCGLLANSIYIGITELLYVTGVVGMQHPSGMISAVLFLVPGFPLVTSILDLVRMDFAAGISRVTYVLMLVISAGISVWMIASIFQWHIDPPKEWPASGPALYLLQFVCSFVAAFGFAILFSIRPKVCLAASLLGGVVNVGRIYLVSIHFPWQGAVGLACLVIGLAAHVIWQSTGHSYSRVSLTVPAVVIMIPGVPLYAAITHLSQGEIEQAVGSLAQVFLVVLSIGIGLAISRMVTDPNWRIDRDVNVTVKGTGKGERFYMR